MTEDRDYHPRGLLRYPTYAFGKLHKGVHTRLGTELREHWVLTYLAEYTEITQQDMAGALAIDRSEVVRLVDTLEKAGLVSRTRDSHDRRKYRLALTPAGDRKRHETDARLAEATDELLYRLSPSERATLHELALKALGYDASEL
ncbi:MarR family winged helix-turn-helix transcriptional regulator [Nocardia sp. NPDC055321]